MQHFMDAMNHYADFSGRARRKSFWMFYLFYIIFAIVAGVVDGILGSNGIVSIIYLLAMLIPTISLTVRRLHDTTHSGWWILIGLVPLVGPIVLLIFYLSNSHPGENIYGPNPKDVIEESTAL